MPLEEDTATDFSDLSSASARPEANSDDHSFPASSSEVRCRLFVSEICLRRTAGINRGQDDDRGQDGGRGHRQEDGDGDDRRGQQGGRRDSGGHLGDGHDEQRLLSDFDEAASGVGRDHRGHVDDAMSDDDDGDLYAAPFAGCSSSLSASRPVPEWQKEAGVFDQDEVAKKNMDTDYGIRTYKMSLKKGDKDTFYCALCKVELNSRETKQSHISGARHRAKVASCSRAEAEAAVVKIPNPPELRKKIPERLEKLVRQTKEPVVGLKHVTEYVPESNDEMDPHYECSLCENQGEANAMFNHILGRDHRARFFGARARGGRAGSSGREYGTMELLRKAEAHAENDVDVGRMVERRVSDAEYPWPAGKAPWSIERGGDGQAPMEARARKSAPLADSLDRKIPLISVEDCGRVTEDNLARFLDYGQEAAGALLRYAQKDAAAAGSARMLQRMFREMRTVVEDEVAGSAQEKIREGAVKPEFKMDVDQ